MPVGNFDPARAIALLHDAAVGIVHDIGFLAGGAVELRYLRAAERPVIDTDIVEDSGIRISRSASHAKGPRRRCRRGRDCVLIAQRLRHTVEISLETVAVPVCVPS